MLIVSVKTVKPMVQSWPIPVNMHMVLSRN